MKQGGTTCRRSALLLFLKTAALTRGSDLGALLHESKGDIVERFDRLRFTSLYVSKRRRCTQQELDSVNGRFGEVRRGRVPGAQL
jgi:hypothetical protein